MATKPSQFLEWAADGSPTKIYEPPSDLRASGVVAGEAIPFDYFNWLFYTTDRWIKYFEETINYDATSLNLDQTTRLLDGGFWSWNLTTSTLTWDGTMYIAIPSIADADNAIAAGSIVLADGQVAYVAANIPFTTTGNTSSGSPNLTSVAFTNGITVGQTITGTGIPGGTTVVSVAVDSVVMSANASASGSAVNLTFSGIGALTVVAADSATLAPTPNMIILARRHGSAVYVGVNAGQMVMRDGESKRLLRQGFGNVTEFTAGENLAQRDAVYISSTGDTGGRTAGRVYKLDPGTTNGAVRSGFVGFVITAATVGTSVKIVTSGVLGGFSGLTAGAQYYGNTVTPGSYTSTKPTVATEYVILIGIAATATTLLIESQGLNGTIPDGSITTPKLAARAVTPAKLYNNTHPIIQNLATGEWNVYDATAVETITGSAGWRSIVWASELRLFVAVKNNGGSATVFTSPDGFAWTARTISQNNNWNSVCWNGSLFVAVAGTGTNRVMTSPDGVTWTMRSASSPGTWQRVIWASTLSLFVAVGFGSAYVMTSPDGTTWTQRTPAANQNWVGLAWSGTIFAAVATGGQMMSSPDGITWTTRTAASFVAWQDICWANDLGIFCAIAAGGTSSVNTSPDGITWTARTTPASTAWYGVCWAQDVGVFIATPGGSFTSIGVSTDGITWKLRALSSTDVSNWYAITYAPELGLFVGATIDGNKFLTSFYKTQKTRYRTILQVAGSHTAAKVAGTYGFAIESPLVVSGAGSLYPLGLVYLDPADYETPNGISGTGSPKIRIRFQLHTNDVAPNSNFVFGLYPVTRPGTSGGAGVCIYTLGTVVANSTNNASLATPSADTSIAQDGYDFDMPAAGFYCVGVATSATIAASSHVQLMAFLQVKNV